MKSKERMKPMKIIKNYKVLNNGIEEFPYIKIKEDEDVFVDLPICLCEFGVTYKKPMLFVNQINQIPTVLEEEELVKAIENTKIFYLKMDEDERIIEVDKSESQMSYRLPKNTPVDQLAIINGQLGILEKGDN
jgi:thermostable 8-oxoguanine DNA glycosylase